MMETHREYFNRLAPEWNDMMPDEPRLKELATRFDIRPGDRILDIGTGAGRMAAHLAELTGPDGLVVAQDFACNMLIQGARIHGGKNILWLCDDCHHLALAPGSFDKVLCFSAFPHFQDQKAVLEEMHRVLTPDGKLLILHVESSETLNTFHATLNGPVTTDTLPPAGILKTLMQSCGFQVSAVQETADLYWVLGEKR